MVFGTSVTKGTFPGIKVSYSYSSLEEVSDCPMDQRAAGRTLHAL